MRKFQAFKRPKLNSAIYWRRRADDARNHAAAADGKSRSMMLGFAEGYEKMAKRVEKPADH
jgi:hypothetical protein